MRPPTLVRAVALAAALLVPTPGRAQDKVACARAGESAQRLRVEGKLLEAREQLLACARESCPAVVRADCAQWLSDVDASTPSLVVRATDAQGRDLRDVRVVVDGAARATQLDGRPLPLDPGEHAVRVERAGAPPIERRVIVGTGEKNRLLTVTFARDAASPAATGNASANANANASADANATRAREAPIAGARRGPPAAAWILGGASVVALGSFAFFGLGGHDDLAHLRDTCAGHCAQSDVDRAWTKLVVADVSLAAAVVTGGVAAFLFLAPRGLAIAPARDGASIRWSASF